MKPEHICIVQPDVPNFKTIVWTHQGQRETDRGQQSNQGAGNDCFVTASKFRSFIAQDYLRTKYIAAVLFKVPTVTHVVSNIFLNLT